MTRTPKYTAADIDEIDFMRQQGMTWEQIAKQKGKARSVLFTAYKRYHTNGYWRPHLPWRPIESIPSDVMVLVYCEGHFGVVCKKPDHKFSAPWSHWMPLPEEPK